MPVPNVRFALTFVILPLTEIGTVPPWNGASTVPTMLRLMSTVPVPLPTDVVKLIAPLLTVMVKAVELTFDVVFVPLLLTVTLPAYVPEKLPLRMAKVADESRVRSSSISMAAHVGDTDKRERDRARGRNKAVNFGTIGSPPGVIILETEKRGARRVDRGALRKDERSSATARQVDDSPHAAPFTGQLGDTRATAKR
jgi:hypothetical protein